jgi:hypothetical protein
LKENDAWKRGAAFIDLKHLGKNKEEDKPSFLQKNTGSGFYIKDSSTAKNTFNPMMMNPQMQQP